MTGSSPTILRCRGDLQNISHYNFQLGVHWNLWLIPPCTFILFDHIQSYWVNQVALFVSWIKNDYEILNRHIKIFSTCLAQDSAFNYSSKKKDSAFNSSNITIQIMNLFKPCSMELWLKSIYTRFHPIKNLSSIL